MIRGDTQYASSLRRQAFSAVAHKEIRLPWLGWRRVLRERPVELLYQRMQARVGEPMTSHRALPAWLRARREGGTGDP